MNTLARDYVLLAFAIDRHIPGYIDAYFGPPEVKAEADASPLHSLRTLSIEAQQLTQAVPQAGFVKQRADFFTAQLSAMATTISILQGERMPLAREVEAIYGLEPEWTEESVFSEAHRQLAELLPPGNDLPARMEVYRQSAEVKPDAAAPLFDMLRRRMQTLTRRRFSLPAEENFEIKMVTGQPWGAYNWYLGNAHSRVEINTDLPLHATNFLSLIAHEGYPGHHTELASKEYRLLQEHGWQEHGIALINAPSCAISEGIANCALDTLLSTEEQAEWEGELFAQAGLKLDPLRVAQIRQAQKPLGRVSDNAAFLLHDQGASKEETAAYIERWALSNPARARKSVEFISHPLNRSYIFNYTLGMDLLEKLFAAKGNRQVWFTRLLGEPVTPKLVRRWIERAS
jgi:hypothetical protein